MSDQVHHSSVAVPKAGPLEADESHASETPLTPRETPPSEDAAEPPEGDLGLMGALDLSTNGVAPSVIRPQPSPNTLSTQESHDQQMQRLLDED